MNILGLHFGHDASISLIRDGKIIFCYEKERYCRVRHVIGLTSEDIIKALKEYNYSLKDIDFCSITSTQNIEYLFFDDSLKFNLDLGKLNSNSTNWYQKKKKNIINQIKKKRLINLIKRESSHPYTQKMDFKQKRKNFKYFGSIEEFFVDKKWRKKNKLKNMERYLLDKPLDKILLQSMSLPIKLRIKKKIINGNLFSHHYAHAAYSFYTSNFKEAAIFTQDGAIPESPYLSGMCYYGKDNYLIPLVPHYLNLGRVYDSVSELVGFDRTSGPGKIMGLASYGKAKFYNKKFIGNIFDHEVINQKIFKDKKINWKPHKIDVGSNKWISYCLFLAKKLNYDFSNLGNTKKILSKINIDIAASTQKLFEETMIFSIKKLKMCLKKIKINSNNLCLSGGTSLNCPANTKVFNKKIFKNIFIPPAVHDGGLSTGSALATYYNQFSKKRKMIFGNKTSLGFQGQNNKDVNATKIFKNYNKKIIFKKINNPYKKIAKNISEDKIVSVIYGGSEVGPRALGNRSILADPRKKQNWLRVNKIKRRESWRPFAPVVLQKQFKKYFYNSPEITPFMLFTSKVKSKLIPAVTHVDFTARAQTVNDKKLPIFKILNFFYKITKIPLVMNTSFNGPGEPIVQNLNDALDFFVKSDVDLLYYNNFEIRKKC